MELRFDKEIEKLKNCSDLQEFFEIKREILHKIADYIGSSEELHEQIDKTYTNIPDDKYVNILTRYASQSMIKKLTMIVEIGIYKLSDIPIWRDTCPFCMRQRIRNKLGLGFCVFCEYADCHGLCDDNNSDWNNLKIGFKKYIKNIGKIKNGKR